MQFARFARLLLPALAALALHTGFASSQSPGPSSTLTGRVVKEGAPVPGLAVTLHQVTSSRSGAVSERTTGPDGSFSFELPPPDTTAFNVFFASVDYESVRYFGEAVHRNEVPARYEVVVYDTASALPGAVRVTRRYVVLLQETDGSWTANEAIRATNTADRTLVSARGEATWEFALPEGVSDFEVTEGLIGEGELQLMGDRALFLGSLPPGDRELVLRYRLPADGSDVQLTALSPTDTLYVFVPEAAGGVRVSGLASTLIVPVDNQRFIRYGATDLAAGQSVELSWEAGGPPADPVIAGVAAALVVLGVGSWLALRNRGAVPGVPGRG